MPMGGPFSTPIDTLDDAPIINRELSRGDDRRHQREALQRGALYWKTGLSHALDTALEIIGIYIWQDVSLPLD